MMSVEELISTMDLWSFIAAIVSLVLAIVAIVYKRIYRKTHQETSNRKSKRYCHSQLSPDRISV